MAKTGYKAYTLAVKALGLGITAQGIKWCWSFAILPEDVPSRLLELAELGFVSSAKAAKDLHDARGMSASATEREQAALVRIMAEVRKQG